MRCRRRAATRRTRLHWWRRRPASTTSALPATRRRRTAAGWPRQWRKRQTSWTKHERRSWEARRCAARARAHLNDETWRRCARRSRWARRARSRRTCRAWSGRMTRCCARSASSIEKPTSTSALRTAHVRQLADRLNIGTVFFRDTFCIVVYDSVQSDIFFRWAGYKTFRFTHL